MIRRILLSIVIFIAGLGTAFSQVSLTNVAPTATINFSNTMQPTVGTNPGTAFTGAGFAPAPTSATYPGRLNSNAWETTGWANGDLLFGSMMVNPAHGRGSVAGGVVTEGIYAYTDTPATVANPTLLIQPADGDFAPGSIALKIKNNGTANMTQITVSYNLFVRNDENTSSSFNFSHSSDNIVYQADTSMDYTSPDVADAFQWVSVDVAPSRSTIISGINVAPGGYYYIRWTCEDVSGTGPRDEFGLDDIIITGTYGAPAPEINVTGNTTTILNNDMTPAVADGTQFANTFTGGSASLIGYEIQNVGGLALNIGAITISGVNPGDFTIQGTAPSGNIAAVSGSVVDYKTLTIKFTPAAPGIRSAIISIANTDSNENPYTFKVQGLGVIPQPDIEVSGTTAPNTSPIYSTNMIPVTANCTLFAPQAVGGPGQTLGYKIKNNGTAALLILTGPSPYVTITGANPSDFTLVTFPTSATMNPGFTKTFSINFAPTAAGIRTALVTIANNDTVNDVFGNPEGPFTFLIQGTGISPEMELTGNLQPILDGSITPSFSNHTFFDYLNIVTGTLDRTYTIQNTGSMSLSIGAVTITGSTDYTLLTPPAASVAPAASTTFTIRFNPTTVGIKNAIVNIVNNDPNENPYNFAISGYGLDYTPCNYGIVETIAIQDFEVAPATPVWTFGLTGTTTTTNGTGYGLSGDGGLSDLFIGGRSMHISNSTAVVTLAPINTLQYSDIELNLRVGSYSTNITDGSDATDKVVVAVSINGGAWSNELEVKGITDSKWSFISGTGIATAAYDGNNAAVSFSPALSGFVTADGYSTMSLTGLPKAASVAIRITVNNNNVNEMWALDNATLFGRKEVFTTWDGSVWTPAPPTSTVKAVINGNYDTNVSGNLQACKCQINAGKTVTIQSNDFFSIESDLSNSGTIVIEDKGSLVQRNDFAVNSGNIAVKRYTTPMTKYDYTYWSSPVQSQTLFNLSPLTLADKYFQFDPVVNNWQNVLGSTTMAVGRGYIARAPQNFDPVVAAQYTGGQFNGAANNGFLQTPITGAVGAWNLIGNPYPSAIDADLFLGFSANTGVVGGTIYFWTHNTPITNYVYTSNDYAVYNLTGGVATAAPSSTPLNNNTIPTGNIASGQGFFIAGLSNGPVTFNNSMRLTGNNDAFYRESNATVAASVAPEGIEKNRMWLDLTNEQGAFKQTLVGYIEGATDQIDRSFDGLVLNAGNSVSIYSIVENQLMAIQGRGLPFNINDTVPLGYVTGNEGVFSISLEQVDGFMSTQNIYLEDKLLNIIHDLKASPYSFNTLAGTFDERFELRYTPNALGNHQFAEADNSLVITVKNHNITVFSNNEIMEDIAVYDLLGRNIFKAENVKTKTFQIDNAATNQQALIVKVKLENGTIVNRKIIF